MTPTSCPRRRHENALTNIFRTPLAVGVWSALLRRFSSRRAGWLGEFNLAEVTSTLTLTPAPFSNETSASHFRRIHPRAHERDAVATADRRARHTLAGR